jgi:hypothetical protein
MEGQVAAARLLGIGERTSYRWVRKEPRWDALLENLEQQHIVIRLDPVRLVVVMPVAAMIVSVPMAVVMASAAEQQDAGDID